MRNTNTDLHIPIQLFEPSGLLKLDTCRYFYEHFPSVFMNLFIFWKVQYALMYYVLQDVQAAALQISYVSNQNFLRFYLLTIYLDERTLRQTFDYFGQKFGSFCIFFGLYWNDTFKPLLREETKMILSREIS